MEPLNLVKVALVDDHVLFRKGMAELINGSTGFLITLEANNGKEFIDKLADSSLPDIVLLDIEMAPMDGYETASWLSKHYPTVKVLALSMYNNEKAIIGMIKSGAKGYLLKDAEPYELFTALTKLQQNGSYYPDLINKIIIDGLRKGVEQDTHINDREKEFLAWVCTELTYKEIADKMCISVRTVDGYRDALFRKLSVMSRVGLAIYAIKYGFFKI